MGSFSSIARVRLVWSLYWIPCIVKEVSLLWLVGVRVLSSVWALGIIHLTSLFNCYFLGSLLALNVFILCIYKLYSAKNSRRLPLIFLELFLFILPSSLVLCPVNLSCHSLYEHPFCLPNLTRPLALFAFPLPTVWSVVCL